MPLSAALTLRAAGWAAIHVRELGQQQASDTDILAAASAESRVVVTLDLDFPQILALPAASRPSVVLIRQRKLRGPAAAELLVKVWEQHEAALDEGCVLKVSQRGVRIRRLPLQ